MGAGAPAAAFPEQFHLGGALARGWSTLSDARDPARIRPGVMVVAGNRQAQAVVRVVAVDDDGQVHFAVLPGSVAENSHLIGRALA